MDQSRIDVLSAMFAQERQRELTRRQIIRSAHGEMRPPAPAAIRMAGFLGRAMVRSGCWMECYAAQRAPGKMTGPCHGCAG